MAADRRETLSSVLLFRLLSTLLLAPAANSDPLSTPYVAFRTDPYGGGSGGPKNVTLGDGGPRSGTYRGKAAVRPAQISPGAVFGPEGGEGDPRCPLAFRLGLTHRSTTGGGGGSGGGIHGPAVTYPAHPHHAGPGKQVLFVENWERLDMLTPSSVVEGGGEGMEVDEQFPLLFEGANFFHSVPTLHDENGDGIMDATVVDYDGGIYTVGLDYTPGTRSRYVKAAQIPRLYVRKDWVESATNLTAGDDDGAESHYPPYHSYFEYGVEWKEDHDNKRIGVSGGGVVSADVLSQSVEEVSKIEEERRRRWKERQSDILGRKDNYVDEDRTGENLNLKTARGDEIYLGRVRDGAEGEKYERGEGRRRLQEETPESDCGACFGAKEPGECCNTCAEIVAAYEKKNWAYKKLDFPQCVAEGDVEDNNARDAKDDDMGAYDDDVLFDGREAHDDDTFAGDDDFHRYHGGYHDDYPPYDDYYGGENSIPNFYDDDNYIRLSPHVLAQQLNVEIPKRYKSSLLDNAWAVEEYLIIPVSYYMDEDEFTGIQSYRRFLNKEGGDETEVQRGQYVSSAVLFYNREYGSFTGQTHLDLSTDWTAPVNTTMGNYPVHDRNFNGYGAFALSSPTVVSFGVDGVGNSHYHVIMGTSMGLLYVLDIPNANKRSGFPVRFPYPILRRPVVEDVLGDVTPEIIGVDAGGNIACLDSSGTTLWNRDLLTGERDDWNVMGTSDITLGDVDGDGNLDAVILLRLVHPGDNKGSRDKRLEEYRLYVIDAQTGDDVRLYPMSVDVMKSGVGESDRDRVANAELPLPQPLLVDLHESQEYWLDRIRRNTTVDVKVGKERDAAEARRINEEATNAAFPAGKNWKVPHGGMGRGLHIVQPIQSFLYIIEGGTGCIQTVNIGDVVPSMVQVDDVHGTGSLDLIVTTSLGQVLTLEASNTVPFHPLNVWNSGPVRSRINGHAQGYSATSGIFVHERSRAFRRYQGIFVKVTFEIFDQRPNVWKEGQDKRKYIVDMRQGTSTEKMLFRKVYDSPGIYTEKFHVPFGPGYYSVTSRLTTVNGLIHEDTFSFAYNVHYDQGLSWLVLVPLILAAIPLLSITRKPSWEEDDDFMNNGRILG